MIKNNKVTLFILLTLFSFLNTIETTAKGNINELTQAAYQGNLSKVQELLNEGVNINGEDSSGKIALNSAILGERFGNKTLSVIQELISRGADLDRVSEGGKGQTALITSIKNWGEDHSLILLLLYNGADPNKPDGQGKKPSDFTADSDIKKWLQNPSKALDYLDEIYPVSWYADTAKTRKKEFIDTLNKRNRTLQHSTPFAKPARGTYSPYDVGFQFAE